MNMKLYMLGLVGLLAAAVGYRYYKKHNGLTVSTSKQLVLPMVSKLTVKPAINRSCEAGELNYLKSVHGMMGDLLVTLEAVPGGLQIEPRVKKINVTDLFQMNPMDFSTKGLDPKRNYDLSIVICSDKTKRGRCLGKPDFDFNEANKKMALNQDLRSTNKGDNIYYFQYLAIKDGQITFLDIENIEEEQFPGYLSTLVSDKSKSEKDQRTLKDFITSKVMNLGSKGVGLRDSNNFFQVMAQLNLYDSNCGIGNYADNFFRIIKENPKQSQKKRKESWKNLPEFSRQ